MRKTNSVQLKYGAHQFLWKHRWTDRDSRILDTARRLGCTVFEISLGDDVTFDRARLGRHATALGMELTVGPGNSWPPDCNISADEPAYRKRGLAWHQKIIQQAAELGAVAYCGAIYGYPGYVLRRRPPADEQHRAAEHLHTLAEFASQRGIKLVIEPMSRFRNHLVNTADQAIALVRRADHPNLLVNLDTYHLITEERDYRAAIRRTLPVLWGIHACENDRGVPGGGLVPWPDVFSALAAARGDVRVMLETYNTAVDGAAYARGIFQNLCPDPVAFVRTGLAFLRGCERAAQRKSRRG